MRNISEEELKEALRPIASLISKSEKAQQKLVPGTWQHKMLQDNLKALYIATKLMNSETVNTDKIMQEDLRGAIRALDSMISRSEKAQTKFSPGTSQHTLQRNRINALRMASEWIGAALAEQESV